MSTPEITTPIGHGRRSASSTILAGVGVLIAIGLALLALALTGANHHPSPTAAQASRSTRATYLDSRPDKTEVPVRGTAAAAKPLRFAFDRPDKTSVVLL